MLKDLICAIAFPSKKKKKRKRKQLKKKRVNDEKNLTHKFVFGFEYNSLLSVYVRGRIPPNAFLFGELGRDEYYSLWFLLLLLG
jgi:hypothetical protein